MVGCAHCFPCGFYFFIIIILIFFNFIFLFYFYFLVQVGAVQRKYPLLFGEVEDRAPGFTSLGQALSSHLSYTVGFTWHLAQVPRKCSAEGAGMPQNLSRAFQLLHDFKMCYILIFYTAQRGRTVAKCVQGMASGKWVGSCVTAVWLFHLLRVLCFDVGYTWC